jgi:hypothetical protein
MWLLRKMIGLLLLTGAALMGNWIGSQMRAKANGGQAKPIGMMQTSSDGRTTIALNVTLTNFIPALLLGMLSGRPKSVYAFVSGAVISALVGDTYERTLGLGTASWIKTV